MVGSAWLLSCASLITSLCRLLISVWSEFPLLETVKLIPKHKVNYRVFGKPQGPHYAHYDLIGGRLVFTLSDDS
jgi:hypothetical protein